MEKTDKPIDQKAWRKHLKKLSKMPPPVIEHKSECSHKTLNKIGLDDGVTYQCPECQSVFDVFGAAMYSPTTYLKKALAIAEHFAKQKESGDEPA